MGDDSGKPLPLPTFAIAEKFVEYYWRHAIPYTTANGERVLRQNTGQPAKIITLVEDARSEHGDSLPSLMRDVQAWRRLVRKIEAVVKVMPLWNLQTVGKDKLEFLYGPSDHDDRIELRSGVAYCFRQFYSLIQDAVRSAWLRDVRSLNGDMLGESLDLREFLFGAERNALRAVRPVLMELQRGAIPKIIPFTSYPGRQTTPAFSPDAKQVAFAWDGEQGGNFDIYNKLVNAGTPLRLTTNPADEYAPAWSPDGRYIAFCRDRGEHADIWMIPALGGTERKLGEAAACWGLYTGFSWSRLSAQPLRHSPGACNPEPAANGGR